MTDIHDDRTECNTSGNTETAHGAVSGLAINVAANGVPSDLLLPIQPVFRHLETGKLAGGKKPAKPNGGGGWDALHGWENGVSDHDLLAATLAGCNVGVRLGMPSAQPPHINVLAIDLDMKEGHGGARDAFLAVLERQTGAPVLWRETWPYRGLVLVCIASMEAPHIRNWRVLHAGVEIGTIQLLACGQQCVVAGHHHSGRSIRWHHAGNTYQVPPVSGVGLPSFADYDALLAALESAFASLRPYGLEFPLASAGSNGTGSDAEAPEWLTVAKLAEVLDRLPNPASVDRDRYMAICQAIAGCRRGIIAYHGPLADADENRLANAVAGWASRWKGPNPSDFQTERVKWEKDWRDCGNFAGWRHLIGHAKQLGVDLAGESAQTEFAGDLEPPPPPDPVAPEPFADEIHPDESAPNNSQEQLALEFTHRHAGRLRYVAKWGVWLIWDGRMWQVDETHRTFGLARALCRERAVMVNDDKNGNKAAGIASRRTASDVLTLAQADRRHAATTDQWDADPWLLNTPGGIVNLRTGAMLPHDPARHMTKMTAVAPGGGCPRWLAFLDQITDGDKALQTYLQRVCGYALTGVTSEHAFLYGYGTGRNGKSVFLDTVAGILDSYAVAAPPDTFTASQNESHPTEIARLRGARFVTGQETEEGKRWNETRIKQLSGANAATKVPARFMRQDFFEFTPQCKIFLIGNTKPQLRRVDQAIKDRFQLVPFTVYIPPEQRDRDLPDKLRGEWPGILQWMIAGCLEWQKIGLMPPPAVANASREYLDGEDRITQWISECCEAGPDKSEASSRLFQSYKRWMALAGESALTQKAFSQELESRRFAVKRTNRGSDVIGLALAAPEDPEWAAMRGAKRPE